MRTEMVIKMQQASSEKGHANNKSKAMKIAAETRGVESVALAGKDRSLLVVVGDGVDCNDLITRLRKKVGRADLVELRTLHDTGGGGYRAAGLDYGNGGSFRHPAPASAEYYDDDYSHRRPSYSYEYYNPRPPPYAATVVHREYYYPAGDQYGCAIM